MNSQKFRRLLPFAVALALAISSLVLVTRLPALAQGSTPTPCPFGNMMNGGMMSGGMMGNGSQFSTQQCAQIGNMMDMMGGNSSFGNMMLGGMMTGGMMGAWTPPANLAPVAGKSLTFDQATAIAKAYIAAWNSKTTLDLGEVMQFSNHFYGEAIESQTSRGAFEFLIDPITGTVYGEPGPNMMWNLRYSSMGSFMGMSQPTNDGATMVITSDQAVKNASDYLDKVQPGAKAEMKPLAFYGFYTLHILRDGNVIGMLSVNGYTGQVWLHYWHGSFVTMTSEQ